MSKLRIASDLSFPLDTAACQTFACIGRKGSGKSFCAGKLAELFIDAGVQVCILDTVGNWYGLRLAADGKSPGIDIPIFGGLRGDIPLEPTGGALMADTLVESGRSMVIDASQFNKADRQRFATALGQQLWKRKKAERHPAAIHLILEESQLIVPEHVHGDAAAMVGIYEEIIRLGRNYGIGITMITQRPQSVNKEVLNQTECLMVFQVNGAHERKALKEWIVHQGMDPKVLEELPSLKPGDCYVWSPQWLGILQKIHVAPKRTFDSTSTPRVGIGSSRGKDLKPIDLEGLKEKMAATIERAKADDPRELRKRITELEKKLRDRPAETTETVVEKIVEVPVLANGQLDKANNLVERLDAMLSSVRASVGELSTTIGTVDRAGYRTATPKPKVAARPQVRQAKPANFRKLEPDGQALRRELAARNNGELPIGEKKTLAALIQYPAGLQRTQLTVLTGYKTSTRNAYIARLRERGYVDQSGDTVVCTEEGVAALPDYEPLPSGEALQQYWLTRLPEGERAILQVLIDAYPNVVAREDLEEPTGYKTSTRNAYISRLAAKELVTGDRGDVRASDNLFDS